ncbi:MAG TPA: ABC transporter substrate-binding protein, partial [Pyrinomonadaceae bacterium]|nr:ABC transporter substrate-binding protein [Pyrinomonadaceae bacterium]
MRLLRKSFRYQRRLRTIVVSLLLLALMLSHAGCFLKEKLEPYYGSVVVPRAQEFHWSDGGLPQTFDPAFAAAPPDTDLVRAIFEGLTDYDPRTLTPVPAVATRWEPSNGGRVWTFYLRDDARWSNGEAVTADDFVRSWRRTMKIGDLAPHTELLANIEGTRTESVAAPRSKKSGAAGSRPGAPGSVNQDRFGVEALSDRVLRVRLRRPDLNFPALVAHPVFRPVKVKDESDTGKLAAHELISNGAFSLASTESERVLLERAGNYWDREQVTL